MATAVEYRAQEHIDAFFRHGLVEQSSAHRQNISIIMIMLARVAPIKHAVIRLRWNYGARAYTMRRLAEA
jgi:hypothetical protein